MSKRKLILINRGNSTLHVECRQLEADKVKKLKIRKIKTLTLPQGGYDILLYYTCKSIKLNAWPKVIPALQEVSAPCEGAFTANQIQISSPGLPVGFVAKDTLRIADIISHPSRDNNL